MPYGAWAKGGPKLGHRSSICNGPLAVMLASQIYKSFRGKAPPSQGLNEEWIKWRSNVSNYYSQGCSGQRGIEFACWRHICKQSLSEIPAIPRGVVCHGERWENDMWDIIVSYCPAHWELLHPGLFPVIFTVHRTLKLYTFCDEVILSKLEISYEHANG